MITKQKPGDLNVIQGDFSNLLKKMVLAMLDNDPYLRITLQNLVLHPQIKVRIPHLQVDQPAARPRDQYVVNSPQVMEKSSFQTQGRSFFCPFYFDPPRSYFLDYFHIF